MNLIVIFILLLGMALLHFIAVLTGLYGVKVIWIDSVLHIIAGLSMALLWLWFLQYKRIKLKRGTRIWTTLLFVMVIAILWELIEFLILALFPDYALSLKIYSPTIIEALKDIFFNLIGGLMIILLNKK